MWRDGKSGLTRRSDLKQNGNQFLSTYCVLRQELDGLDVGGKNAATGWMQMQPQFLLPTSILSTALSGTQL